MQVAAIISARLIMQQFASLPECMAQGGFFSSGSYSAGLPDHATPGRTINIPVSQLVPAGGADRFDLLLRSQLPGNMAADLYLYRFHLYLSYNKNDQLDLGETVISLPGPRTGCAACGDSPWWPLRGCSRLRPVGRHVHAANNK